MVYDKEIDLILSAKTIEENDVVHFKNIQSLVNINSNQINVKSFTMQAGNNLQYRVSGGFDNLGSVPYGMFSVAINGIIDETSQETTKTILNFFTHLPIKAELTNHKANIAFNVITKFPSFFLNNIHWKLTISSHYMVTFSYKTISIC